MSQADVELLRRGLAASAVATSIPPERAGRTMPSGSRISAPAAERRSRPRGSQLYTLRNGKVIRVEPFADGEEARCEARGRAGA